jgi:hypothetical protein
MKSYESIIVTTANNIQDTDKDQLQFFCWRIYKLALWLHSLMY